LASDTSLRGILEVGEEWVVHDPRTVAVVRRGEADTFEMLTGLCRGTEVQVRWDRRFADRRTGPTDAATERRRGERRQPPRTTWRTLGFAVVASRERAPAP
jgi:hypothetical protein